MSAYVCPQCNHWYDDHGSYGECPNGKGGYIVTAEQENQRIKDRERGLLHTIRLRKAKKSAIKKLNGLLTKLEIESLDLWHDIRGAITPREAKR